MRAAVVEKYGGPEVVRIVEVPRPTPRAGQVLVRVVATAVTSGDARIRGARFPRGFGVPARLAFGLRRPRRPVLGNSFSGVVEQVGAGVAGFAVGDEVCGMTGLKMGTHAEMVAVPARVVARKPAGVSHDEAAGLLFGGTTALYFLRDKSTVRPGTSVLVNGASGAVGTAAVQLARHLGGSVTGVTSGPNAALVTRLGATRVVDHTVETLADQTATYDVVLDTVGNLTIPAGRRLLADGGTLLLAVAGLADSLRARGDVAAGSTPERLEDVDHLLGLVADGTLTVVVDATRTLDRIGDAHRLVDTGHKVGNLVVRP